MTALAQPAPSASPSQATVGGAAAVVMGGRYALSNNVEVAFWGFFEPPVHYYFNGSTTVTGNGAFPGTSTDVVMRYGGLAGIHYARGVSLRLTVGVEAGWSHRSVSSLDVLNDAQPSNVFSYGLGLPNYSSDNLVVSPCAGLEWMAGDHYSVSLLPRVQFLVGAEHTWAVTVPLTLSWSWFL